LTALERFLLVAAGGAAGSMVRYWAATQFGARAWTTFWVNITGSLLIGLVASATNVTDLRLRLLLATGFLGGYTTFSAWQLEALVSAKASDWLATAAILLGSVVSGFAAVALGFFIGSRLR